jgi:hypothetical protein
VPVCPRGIQPLRQVYGGEWPSQRDMIVAGRELDFDCVLTWSPGEKYAPEVRIVEADGHSNDGTPLRRTLLETSRGSLERIGYKTGPMIAGAHISSLTSAAPGEGMVTCERDVEILEVVYRRTAPEDVRVFAELESEMGSGGLVQGEVANPVNLAVRDVGLENLMLMYMDDRALAGRILAVYQSVALWQEEALLDAGAPIIYSDGVWCTTDLWSRPQIDDLIAPLIREQAALAHQAGAYFHLFMDGNCMAALESVAQMGVDILSPLETPPSGDANVAEAKRRIGDSVCLWGGVNAYWDVMHGSKDRVREAVRAAISAGAAGGGYVLSTADSVYEPCPLDNVREFLLAGREYGRYQA